MFYNHRLRYNNDAMSTSRKILVGLLLLAMVGGLGFALYYVFFRPTAPPPVAVNANGNANAPTGGLTQAGSSSNLPYVPPPVGEGTGGLTPASPVAKGGPTFSPTLVDAPTLGEKLAADGKTIRYYDKATGKFMTVDGNGKIIALSDEVFPDVSKVTWSGDGTKVVMEFPDGSKLVYDFTAKKQATIPQSWTDFSFSPSSNQIAALQVSESDASRYLVTSNADGTGVRAVEPLGDNADKVTVAWSPTNDVLAVSATGDAGNGFGVKNMLFIGKNGENFPSTEVDGMNFTPLWSPDGAYMLYSAAGSSDDFKPRLYAITGSGDNRGGGRRAINLYTTADQCTFSDNRTAYCSVPDSMPDGAGMSPEVLSNIPDSIYKVNVVTGAVTLIGRPDTDTAIASLSVSQDGTTLFFTDQASGNIKKMMLK